MHIVEKPPSPPATTAQLAALEFKAATAIAQMPKEARQRVVKEMATAVYTAALVGIEIVAEGKAALIERLQADYDTLAPMLMELAKVSKIRRELLDIIAAAECWIAIALAVVEGDGGPDDPPDGDGDLTAHGFRATFKTWASKRTNFLIEKSPDANLGMRGLATDSANCWRRSGAPWGKAFRWFARIGPTPRRPIAFSLMTGSARRTFWPVIFNRRVIAWSPPMVSFLCSMTRPSSPTKERTRKRSA